MSIEEIGSGRGFVYTLTPAEMECNIPCINSSFCTISKRYPERPVCLK